MNLNDFAIRLSHCRIDAFLTPAEVSELIGVHRSTVWGWEAGNVKPPYDKLIALAKLYNVTTDHLLGMEPRETVTLRNELTDKEKQFIKNTVAFMADQMIREKSEESAGSPEEQ